MGHCGKHSDIHVCLLADETEGIEPDNCRTNACNIFAESALPAKC
jgi:hypothetical protein